MKSRLSFLVIFTFSILLISSLRIETDPEKNGNTIGIQTSNYCACKPKPDYYVEVALREIYVTVKDENGKHVKDLKPEEFKLWEDGVEQKILAADKVDFKKTELESAKSVESSGTPVSTAVIDPAPKRYLTLLIGNLPELGVERDKSRSAILHFINNIIRPDDYLSLYVLNPSSLDLIVPFNINPQQSKAAVLKYLENEDFGGRGFKSTQRGALESANLVSEYMKIDDSQIKNMEFLGVAKLLDSLCKGLQYIDGKKDVIIFSEGLFFGPDLSKEMQSIPGGLGSAKLGPSSVLMYSTLLDLKKIFVKNDISLQVIDLGKPAYALPDITESAFRRAPRPPKRGGGNQDEEDTVVSVTDENSPTGPELARTEALLTISASSGGKFYQYSNSMDKITRNLDSVDYDTSFYYILSYTSNADADPDDYLPIKVLVSRDDVKLRYKKGIVVHENFENLDENEQNFQLNFITQSSNLYNMISICSSIAILPAGGNKSFMVYGVQMPLEEITAEGKVDMDIFINVFNKNNEAVENINRQLKFNLSKDALKGKPKELALYSTRLMAAGEYRVKYLIRNRNNMLISGEEFKVNVPDFSGRELILSSPLIYTGASDILKLDLDDEGKEKKSTEMKSVFSFLPGVYFISNEMKNVKKIKIGIMIKGLTASELSTKGNGLITWEAVKPTPEGFAKEPPVILEYKIEDVIEYSDKTLLTLFELDIRDLPKGECDLIIRATKNGLTTSSSIKINII